MKLGQDSIEFEYLSAVSSSGIGNDEPVVVKSYKTDSFVSPNAPGSFKEFSITEIEEMGKNSVRNLMQIFSE